MRTVDVASSDLADRILTARMTSRVLARPMYLHCRAGQCERCSSEDPGLSMKCQQCDKPATFHITELTGGKPQELHLCEDHARQYLTPSSEQTCRPPAWPALLAQQMAVAKRPRNWPARSAGCPVCGITFYEIPQPGPVGLPARLRVFHNELEPLIREHPRRDGRTWASVPRRGPPGSRKADPVDSPAPRDEGGRRERKLRSGLETAR